MHARHWLGLNDSSTRSYFFTPRAKGGLGLSNPRVIYHATKMQFYMSVLNSDDAAVRQAARESLELHMKKRKAVQCTEIDNSFAGFAVAENKITKLSKVNWPKSNWVHLFEICQRENIKLVYNEVLNLYMYILSINDVSVEIAYPKPFYKRFKEMKLKQFQVIYHSMSSQGRVAREADKCVDTRLSSSYLSNHKLSDDIVSFVSRGRLQLRQCNSLLHLYYDIPKHCKLCDFPSDTVSHILNGCQKLKNMYQQRHNRIVNLIYQKIKAKNMSSENVEVIQDSVLKPSKFNSEKENFTCLHTRPDIIIINKETKEVQIVEISTPFDAFLDKCYNGKFNKYFPLSMEINETGFRTKILVLLIGSLGQIHNKFVTGLKTIGLSGLESKFMAKYCATSVIIGSFKIWKFRCKFIDRWRS